MHNAEAPTVATSGLQGPVRLMTSQLSEWDQAQQGWGPARHQTKFLFDNRGRATELDQSGVAGTIYRTQYRYGDRGRLIEVHAGPIDGQPWITRYSYDDQDRIVRAVRTSDKGVEELHETHTYDQQGRRISIQSLPEGVDAFGIDGSDQAYGAGGARTQTTYYDEQGRSTLSIFHDAANRIVRRVTFARDPDGRVIQEESSFGDVSPFGDLPLAQLSPDERERMLELVRFAFDRTTTKFFYDPQGLIIERVTHLGQLGEDRHVYQYDEHGNRVLETSHEKSSGIGFDDEGMLQARNERSQWNEFRMAYVYDARGNWVERVVSSRRSPEAGFVLGNIKRRVIEYY